VDKLADEMTGMTGADIETLVKKKAPARARRRLFATVSPEVLLNPDGFDVEKHFKPEDFKIIMDDLWLSLMEMVLGNISETKGRRLDPKVKKMISYHEAGHLTLAMRKLLQNTGKWDGQYGDDITDISILGPNGVGGFVRTTPKHDFGTAKYLKSQLAIAHAGNAAERIFLGDTTGGCQNDLQQSNRIVKAMLLQLNMSHCHNFKKADGTLLTLPAISVDQQGGSQFLGGQRTHAPQYGMSDFSASQVDQLIGVFLDEASKEATAYLEQERGWIEFFVPKLLAKERMRFAEIKTLWDEYHHTDTDLSRSFAFTYEWDANHLAAKAAQ
jgi:cell division protease FtsH